MCRTALRFAIRLGLTVILLANPSFGATPSSGTVSQANPMVTWTGQIPTDTSELGSSGCNGPNDPGCDNFKLTIVPPDPSFGPYVVVIQTTSVGSADWDLQVYDPSGKLAGSSGNGPGTTSPEVETVALFNPPAGTYTVASAPFAPAGGYTGTAQLKPLSATIVSPGTEPLSYAIYPNPNGVNGGEPSIGCNWKTGRAMYQAILKTLRVTFDDCTSPARATWEDKTAPSSVTGFDPILFTDSRTGRSIVSQLISPAVVNGLLVLTAGCSLSSVSDNDGDTWIPSQGCGLISGADHQTVGGGRYHDLPAGPVINPVYPNAVYYCAQSGVDAYCSRSDDGGVNYGPSTVLYTSECGGLHGHVKVAPNDGTVYVPNRNCEGSQGIVVSEDNGLTWSVRHVSNSFAGDNDPSVGLATDGAVYVGYQDSDGHAKVAVSNDRGLTWPNTRDVGGPFGIQNTAFPAVVAGDPLRAAMAFLGTPTAGGSQAADFAGVWHLYVAHTYDGGSTWTTTDATPNDPVQRGCIWLQGGSNPCRNLLDFMDASIDKGGRVLVAVPDGCIGDCVAKGPNSYTALATIARQVNGRRLFAASDVTGVPAAPLVTASFSCIDPKQVTLSWSTPEAPVDAPVTGYKIYKSINGGPFLLFAQLAAGNNELVDNISPSQTVLYKVTAVNAHGESASCNAVAPSTNCPPPQSPCVFPGVTVLTDGTGDFTIGVENDPSWDIQSLNIAEPASLGPGKIMFILKMVSLQNPAKDTTWPITFHAPAGDFWVRMSDVVTPSNPTGAVKFAYGTGTSASALVTGRDNPGTPADPASGFDADGTIRIIIPRSVIGNPAPGQQLTQFLVRIRVEAAGARSLTPDNMPDSTTPAGTYTIFGSENCASSCNAPTANPDSATTPPNQPVVINVVANDTDGGAPPLTVTGVTKPSNGTATNNGDGTVTYTPNSGFTSTDTFKYAIKNQCGKTATGTVTVTVISTQCFEDTDKSISYANGWHTISDSAASAGTFHLDTGNDQHALTFSFTLQADSGSVQYFYATSTKGGTADVYIDGTFRQTVNYNGSSGTMHDPVFSNSSGKLSLTFQVFGTGPHKFELRNLSGPAYVDKFCVTSGSSSAQASAGPGTTTTNTSPLALGQSLLQNVMVPSNALGFSVAAEADVNVPYTLVVIDPTGKVLGTVNSANGIASVTMPVSTTGLYVIQLVNVGLGPVNIWTAATPQVTY